MTIIVTQISEKNKAQWDEFVLQHPNASPYHLFAWCASVWQSYGFQCFYLVAKEKEHIRGLVPLIVMRTLGGKKLLSSLPYCDVGGILSDSPETTRILEEHIFEFARNKNINHIELRTSSNNLLAPTQAPANKKVRMILSLPNTGEELLAQFKSKLRSQIKKAQKNELTHSIIQGNDASKHDIASFYDVIAANMRDLGSPVHSLAWYQAIVNQYKENMFLAFVKKNEIIVGAGLVLKHGNSASIPWASTLKEYNKLAPNMLLYWAVLEACCMQQISTFDFGRSTVGEGTFNFKKQWGCQAQLLDWEEYSDQQKVLPAPASSSKVREYIESAWRHMPLGLTKVIGPKLRKYISL